ncbi:helix-turn-helix transcriptional regulator [Nostoc sp.]|uniref:helix-turn-helix transcriptional regulator n=1 Tax=Nostoc sp. TaxID=1180 RepID=UPI002FF7CC96
MTITLTYKESRELWAEAEINSLQNQEPDEFICQMPRQLGKGYVQEIELYPDVCFSILNYEYHDDVLIKLADCCHPLQFCVSLTGIITDEYGGQLKGGYTLISGGGVRRAMKIEFQKSQPFVHINIEMPPELLATFFPTEDGEIPPQLHFLLNGNDRQTLMYPKITPSVQGVAQQIISCPYQGMMKRMFLQAKVHELIMLQLTPILTDRGELQRSPQLKPSTIARIFHARDILHFCLENPPSILELAQIVGVSDACGGLRLRTLQRGFHKCFGTSVFNYITDKRMEKAERWLREKNRSVAEVANLVGYSHLGQFAAVFKRKFGITPSECLLGKKSGSRS